MNRSNRPTIMHMQLHGDPLHDVLVFVLQVTFASFSRPAITAGLAL